MAVDTDNIEIGEGNLSLKFEGESTATDIGGCSGAVLDVSLKDLDVDVGQYIDPIDTFIIGRKISFEVTFKEDTMRNFVTAFGGDPADIDDNVGDETYSFPANGVETTKYALLVYAVPRVREKTKFKTVSLWRVKATGGLKYVFDKEKIVAYKVTFKAYADATHSGSPGQLVREKLT